MTNGKVIERLAKYAPSVIAANAKRTHRCILATRLGIDTLARFGIHAEPLPVRTLIANKAYLDWRSEHTPESWAALVGQDDVALIAERDRRGAWLLDAGSPVNHDVLPQHWNGHLVVYIPSRQTALDLDAGQMARPAKGIHMPPALVIPWPDLTREMIAHDAHGSELCYISTPENTGYVTGRDWYDPVPALADTLERWIRRG